MTITLTESCPNGHLPTTMFEKTTLLTQLNSGTLDLFCSHCGELFTPSREKQRSIYNRISKSLMA
jgi:hypothetical protein